MTGAKKKLNHSSSSQWAPIDYTDGRSPYDWRSRYEPEARKLIRKQATYLFGVFLLSVVALFYMLYITGSSESSVNASGGPLNPGRQDNHCFIGYLCAWIAGSLGGSLFGIKWMYHSVAKGIWHEDRNLWRYLTPHLSGAVSLVMVLLISSGLLQIFEKDLVDKHTLVIAFGALVGLFSDKALAKMAETADTLFGASKGSSNSTTPQESPDMDEGIEKADE